MNKNQKHVPYTYENLIKGNRLAAQDCEAKASEAKDQAIKAYWKDLLAELDDQFWRYSLAQAVCGNETILVK